MVDERSEKTLCTLDEITPLLCYFLKIYFANIRVPKVSRSEAANSQTLWSTTAYGPFSDSLGGRWTPLPKFVLEIRLFLNRYFLLKYIELGRPGYIGEVQLPCYVVLPFIWRQLGGRKRPLACMVGSLSIFRFSLPEAMQARMLQIGTSDSSHVTAFLHEKSATLVIHSVFYLVLQRLILLILSIRSCILMSLVVLLLRPTSLSNL